MSIHAVTSSAALTVRQGILDAKHNSLSKVEAKEAKDTTTDIAPTSTVTETDADASIVVPDEQETTEAVSGVLDLLEAGHFKGVAEVRLRINFATELADRKAAATAAAIDEQSSNLLETVSTSVDEQFGVLATDAETETAIQDALGAFDAAIAESTSGRIVDTGALESSLQTAFDELVGQLGVLFAPDDDADPIVDGDGATPEPTTSTDGSTTTTDESLFNIDDAMASLTSVFQEALASLLATSETQTTLHEFSQPSGKGVAFDKFLAIYEGLVSDSSSIDQSA